MNAHTFDQFADLEPRAIASLAEILQVEDTEDILTFKAPGGYLLWPLIRNIFLRFIIGDLVYSEPLASIVRPRRNPLGTTLLLNKLMWRNLHVKRSGDRAVLIMATGTGLIRTDGKYFNRLSDHFALQKPKETLCFEDTYGDLAPAPRANPDVLYAFPFRARRALIAKLNTNSEGLSQAKELVAFVAQRAHDVLGWTLSQERADYLTRFLANEVAGIPVQEKYFDRLFRQCGTRLLLKEEGCYGNSSIVNRIAKQRGIVVAEFQHGTINSGHDAYNFSNALLASTAHKESLPDHLLMYGRWWAESMNVAVETTVIGNPHRSESIARMTADGRRGDHIKVLVLGDGIETAVNLDFARSIAQALGSSGTVFFRPHPLERHVVNAGNFNHLLEKVQIDTIQNIYDSFAQTSHLVSETSTALFEAIGLVDQIFIWMTPKARFMYTRHPFYEVQSGRQLVEKMKMKAAVIADGELAGDVWAENWQHNYESFLRRVLA
jgi:hypothetical protein